jgi:hypothetical protein
MTSEWVQGLADRFPRILYGLNYLWKRIDRFKPWKLGRVAASLRDCAEANPRPRENRQVVFVSDILRIREVKLAQALRGAGWEVVLLSRDEPSFDVSACFPTRLRYRDSWEALSLAARYSPLAYHVFAGWSYHTAEAFVRHRPGKIILDPYDILAGMARPSYLRRRHPGQSSLERYCLENADGICCRSIETQYLKREMGYRYRGRRIFFPDFSKGGSSSAAPAKEEGIHVVQIGGFVLEKYSPEMKYHHYLRLARALAEDGVHFHIYATAGVRAGGFEETYSDYFDLARKTGRVHVHRPVPLNVLIEEIQKYTFGLHVAGSELHIGSDDEISLPARYEYSMSNRVYDYFRAGLPVILFRGRFQEWMASRLGVSVLAEGDLLRTPKAWLERHLPSEEQAAKLRRVQCSVVPESQIHRLLRFYESMQAQRSGGPAPR